MIRTSEPFWTNIGNFLCKLFQWGQKIFCIHHLYANNWYSCVFLSPFELYIRCKWKVPTWFQCCVKCIHIFHHNTAFIMGNLKNWTFSIKMWIIWATISSTNSSELAEFAFLISAAALLLLLLLLLLMRSKKYGEMHAD